jgi:hypothetical protein
MALLQAARAYTLGLPLESAHSWGLNRSIFYAAAKRGFRGATAAGRAVTAGRGTPASGVPRERRGGAEEEYRLGDEMAFKDKKKSGRKKPIFVIGGEPQTESDFQRQVEGRFQRSFEDAWKEALEYVQSFDRETLLSGSRFFSDVYRPVRDEFAKKWTEMSSSGGEKRQREEKKILKAARQA